jgi:hypothetical protein
VAEARLHRLLTTARDLLAWQQGIDLVDEIYRVAATFPKLETFGLTSQMRGRRADRRTNIIIASRQHYISNEEAEQLIERVTSVTRLISGLIRHLNRRLKPLRTTNHELRTPRSNP